MGVSVVSQCCFAMFKIPCWFKTGGVVFPQYFEIKSGSFNVSWSKFGFPVTDNFIYFEQLIGICTRFGCWICLGVIFLDGSRIVWVNVTMYP